jgi:hypothetical protein
MVKRNSQNLPVKILTAVVLLVLVLVIGRMVFLIHDRAELARDRLESAETELHEVESLASKLEDESYRLQSELGNKKVLRERYGIVSENEGYLILLHDYTDTEAPTDDDWWQLW